MTIEEEKHCRDLVQQIRDLRSAMCCYDEMLLLLDLVSELWRQGSSESASTINRMERFDIERLAKTRLPEVLKAAKRSRLMRHSDPYWPENFIMSSLLATGSCAGGKA